MNYRNMTNDELVNAAEAARLRNDNPLLTELVARLEAAEDARTDLQETIDSMQYDLDTAHDHIDELERL